MKLRTCAVSILGSFVALLAAQPALAQGRAAHGTAAPCALLSTEQIKAVPGTPVLTGRPGAHGDSGEADCTWADAKGETRVYLKLKDAGVEYTAFRESMQATGRLVPIPGLAEDAFYIASTGASAALYTLKAHHLMLLTVDGVGFTKAENEAAEKGLATAALTKF